MPNEGESMNCSHGRVDLRRRIALATTPIVMCLVFASCGGSEPPVSPTPTPGPPTPSPISSTISLLGGVYAEPGSRGIDGATLTLLDGPDAGRTTSTGADGRFRFDGVRTGQVTASVVTSEFGEDRAWVYANGSNPLEFHFAPEGRSASGTFQGTLRASDATCISPGTTHDGKPCQRYGPFDVAAPGTFWVTLDWLPGPNELDFEIWRNGVRITGVNHQMFGTRLSLGGGNPFSGPFEVRVVYVGTTSQSYQLRVTYTW